MEPDRKAWNVYWTALAVFVLVFVAFALLRGTGLAWGVALATPLVVAGLDLVLFRESHERICAVEVARHRWLGTLTMGGYDRRAFAATGLVLLAFAVYLAAYVSGR